MNPNFQELYGLWGEKSDPEPAELLLPFLDRIIEPKVFSLNKDGSFAHYSAWQAMQTYMTSFWPDSHIKKRTGDEIITGIAAHLRMQEREVRKAYEQTNLCRGNILKEVGRRMSKVHMMEWMTDWAKHLDKDERTALLQSNRFSLQGLERMRTKAFWDESYEVTKRHYTVALDAEKRLKRKIS